MNLMLIPEAGQAIVPWGPRQLAKRKLTPLLGEQELENTQQRVGRRQDKEAAMVRMRMLGFM